MARSSPNLRLVPSRTVEPAKVESILDLIGNTPLLEISRVSGVLSPDVRVYAKLEGMNPGGSVKDRPAWRMVQEGLRTKKLRPGKWTKLKQVGFIFIICISTYKTTPNLKPRLWCICGTRPAQVIGLVILFGIPDITQISKSAYSFGNLMAGKQGDPVFVADIFLCR